jgi:hypothetical protein
MIGDTETMHFLGQLFTEHEYAPSQLREKGDCHGSEEAMGNRVTVSDF